jgi:hypothetical protein
VASVYRRKEAGLRYMALLLQLLELANIELRFLVNLTTDSTSATADGRHRLREGVDGHGRAGVSFPA